MRLAVRAPVCVQLAVLAMPRARAPAGSLCAVPVGIARSHLAGNHWPHPQPSLQAVQHLARTGPSILELAQMRLSLHQQPFSMCGALHMVLHSGFN